MDVLEARLRATEALKKFKANNIVINTPMLNEVENIVNDLIRKWRTEDRFVVVDNRNFMVTGIRLKFDDHSGHLIMSFRYN